MKINTLETAHQAKSFPPIQQLWAEKVTQITDIMEDITSTTGDQSPQHERAQSKQEKITSAHRHAESVAVLMFNVKVPLTLQIWLQAFVNVTTGSEVNKAEQNIYHYF